MRERAARAGGALELVANPAGGLRVTLTVPARAAYLDTPRRG
jgi:signal transduction histidine kinase